MYVPVVTVIAVVLVFISFKLFIHSNKISKRSTPIIAKKRKTYSQKLKQYHITKDNNHNASRTIYTIQTGGFINIANANNQFKSIIQGLNREELDYLRIEKVGKYHTVRFGEFEDYATADKFLKAVKPKLSAAIILKADIKNERIIRSYDEK